MSQFWILNAVCVTQNNNRDVFKGHIHIVDGQIAEIRQKHPSINNKVKTIDASGLWVLPGFVQAHMHLCQTLFRNAADDLELLDWLSQRIWPFEAAHDAHSLYLSARLGIEELLAGGTTCILDMGTIRHTESILKAVVETGIRANVGKCLMDHPRNNPPYLRESTAQALKEAKQLFEKWNGAKQDRIRISYAPRFLISCTDELVQAVSKLAHKQKALIHTHACENRKEMEFVKKMTGLGNIEALHQRGLLSERTVLAHGVWLEDREIALLKKTGTHVVHCPSSNMKLASGIANVPKLLKKGINVALGADGAPCNNQLNAFQEMRFAALLQKPIHGPKAMKAQEVLDMSTRGGAKALNWFDQIGSIEVGKKADFVALNLNRIPALLPAFESPRFQTQYELIASTIVYSGDPSSVQWTMVDGRIIYQQKKFMSKRQKAFFSLISKAQQKILEPIL